MKHPLLNSVNEKSQITKERVYAEKRKGEIALRP
jgi:hypothetical protein